jgi:hypothetical protein
MKFLISKSSGDPPGIPGAFKLTLKYTFHEEKCISHIHPEQLDDLWKEFKKEGSRHKKTKTKWSRDVERFIDKFMIEISTLEEVVELANAHGEVIVGSSYGQYDGHECLGTIEIYDDYRE